MADPFQNLREYTMALCAPLQIEDHTVQPYAFVSPPKWHLGHTTWFFETFCLKCFFDQPAYDPRFSYVFNSYYESQGAHIAQPRRGVLSRPSLEDVHAYRKHVDTKMREARERILGHSNVLEWERILRLGMEHEQQHQELLLMDIQSILFEQPEHPAYSPDARFGAGSFPAKTDEWIEIPGGTYEVGADSVVSSKAFAYDNEGPHHKVLLPAFRIRRHLVNNGEYLEFMMDGGYSRAELWLSDGWRWVQQNQISHPLYWLRLGESWHEYTLNGVQPLSSHRPVAHVNYYEADAFARWKGLRLPTEMEWEVACGGEPRSQLWAWTQSAYLPYPGYRPFDGAFAEYNGKFMIGQMVLRGGCFATPPSHYRSTYRNFFYPEMRWQYSGIRLSQ